MNTALPAMNETAIPVLPCLAVEETEEFYRALGFESTYRMVKPYLYLAFHWRGIDLHFGRAPNGADAAGEDLGGCLIMVDQVAPYHAAFTTALRAHYGKILASGRPRITRYRPGASRFTLIDPSGNSIIFIQRDEPVELEYGGSAQLEGLAKALDNSRIFREFKNDDRAAQRTLRSTLRRLGDAAPAVDRARALAALIELAIATGEAESIGELRTELRSITLTQPEQQLVADELREADDLAIWLSDTDESQPGPADEPY